MTARARRYLHHAAARGGRSGIDHQMMNLKTLMREAFLCGRLAVLPDLMLGSGHNLGSTTGCGNWDKYFDLRASRLLAPDGSRHPLPIVRALPHGPLHTVTLAPRVASATSAEDAELLVRRTPSRVHARDLPGNARRRLFGEVAAGSASIGFDIRPSAGVRALAAPVAADLQTRHGPFAAVHVRRGDRLAQSVVRRATEPRAMRRRLAALGVPDGAAVYFLSDERDSAYWQGLASHYRAVRFVDYPNLHALVSTRGGNAPDNYLLYEVEKRIMQAAAVRIETLPGPNSEHAHGTLVPRARWILFRLGRRVRRHARRLGALRYPG